MPQPTQSAVHINAPLGNVSLAYMQDLSRFFLASQFFPTVPVDKKSDSYYTYPKGQWYRDEAQKRAPGTAAAISGYDMSSDTYNCDVWDLARPVADQIRENADSMLDLDADATKFVTLKLMIRKEIDWASEYFTTGKWTGSTTGSDIAPGTKWNAANSTPIADISAQMDSVLEKTGFLPNTLGLTRKTWTAIKNNADFLGRVNGGATGTEPALVTPRLLAQVLEIDRVLIGGAIKNAAAEGAADSMSFILGSEGALLAYVPPNPGLMTASPGYTFAWRGHTGANQMGMRIKRYRDERYESDFVEGSLAIDHKLVASDLAAFFSDVLT